MPGPLLVELKRRTGRTADWEGGGLHRGLKRKPESKRAILDEYRHILGTVPDHEAAEMLAVSKNTIGNYRRRHDIPACKRFTPRRSDIAPYAHLLGVESDREIARRAGVTVGAVSSYRRTRGIEPPEQQTTEERLAHYRHLLGQVFDRDIAARSGVCTALVGRYRRSLGIPRLPNPPAGTRTSRMEGHEHLLGVEPDAVIAEETGLSLMTVGIYKRDRGISAPRDTTRSHPARRRVLDAQERLGTEPDIALAKELGVSPGTVARVRKELGIASYQGHLTPEAQRERANKRHA